MLKLYRADKKGNKTLPEKYYSDGLLSKQLNSGDNPLPHQKYGWLETIKNHIHYSTDQEKFIYDTTQYLSFTSDLNRAFFFLSTTMKLKYSATDRNSAEAFIFNATIDKLSLKEISEGLFIYSYKCNYNKPKTDPKFQSLLSSFINCNICSTNQDYEHKLLIINAEKYLFRQKEIYPIEYSFASDDKEWLLMPLDPMIGINAIGYQSRIQIADFWTVDFYKYDE